MSCASVQLERVLFALAGTLTLVAVGLGVLVSPWFSLVAVFVALNRWLYAAVGACPASVMLRRTHCFAPAESR